MTEGKTFCIYLAVDEEAIREHAAHGGCGARGGRMLHCVLLCLPRIMHAAHATHKA